jgi:hypothetical protein
VIQSPPRAVLFGSRPRRLASLPEYYWDPRTHRYHDAITKKFVSRKKILQLTRNLGEHVDETMARLTHLLYTEKLSPAQYERAAQLLLKNAYNANVALAKGGWDQMTRFDYARNGGFLRSEYFHLQRLINDVVERKITPAQAEARARLRGNSVFSRYFGALRESQRTRGAIFEKRVTVGDDRVCELCQDLANKGWQPIGTLPVPGNDPHFGCRCDMEFTQKHVEVGTGG